MRVFLLMLGCLLCCRAMAALFLTEDNPPGSDLHAGEVKGISTAVVTEMARRAMLPVRVQRYPWPRAVALARTTPDACVFSAARTPDLERRFRWIGPIGSSTWAFFARDDFQVNLSRLEDARDFQVGVANGSAQADWLRETGFGRLEHGGNDRVNLALLMHGRVDLWLTDFYKGSLLAGEAGGHVRPVFMAREVKYYLACNPSFPAAQAEALERALETMRRDGTTRRLAELHSRPSA